MHGAQQCSLSSAFAVVRSVSSARRYKHFRQTMPTRDDNSCSSFDEREEAMRATSAAAPLHDVLALMRKDKFQSTIPDAVTEKILQTSGCSMTDPKLTKLISLAAQTFMAVIAKDTLQHYKMRGAPQSNKCKGKDGKDEPHNVLLMEDLISSVDNNGIVARKPPYFV